MAGRKAQHDAEYFPFFAKDGRTLFMLQSKFGLEGIGFFTNLLRLLCTTPHHHLDLSDPMQALYTWSKIGLNDEDKAVKIIEMMVATGKIDRQLWTEKRVIYSQDFVDSLGELYAKRKEKALTISDIRRIYSISAPEMPISAPVIHGNANNRDINTQRKGKERKEEENLTAPASPTRETPFENQPTQDDFDPQPNPLPTHGLKPPKGLTERFTNDDLDEVRQRFGTRAQEALEIIALKLEAGDYKRFTRPWGQVKTWLAKEASALSWLDKATGKGGTAGPTAKPVDTRNLNEPPVPEDERVDLGAFSPEDFLRMADDDFEPRAAGA